ncbi:MAG: glycerol-3-phosphate 1-O-acyltransferase PlsY [SAR202 cluster bacterium]|nr:glycerol-3-phosphate 1-O-acyltransferase PlsY [SAR202 cluster bacterium]|tara:strand:- start:21914 stop:22546 length:633 start_codon:yes stop_codon:yes gene_type:complete
MISLLGITVFAYLLGSIPSGLIAGKLRGIDIRTQGSGSTGSTNALRLLGPRIASIVLAADVLKGALPVLIVANETIPISSNTLGAQYPAMAATSGLAAIAGHNWPIFAKFRGGRGVAPALGAALVMTPLGALAGLALWGVFVGIWRYVSLASLTAVMFTGGLMVINFSRNTVLWPYAVFGGVTILVVLYQHKENIKRLIQKKEPRLGENR